MTDREKTLLRAQLLSLGNEVGVNVRGVDLTALPSEQARAMHLFLVRVQGRLDDQDQTRKM